MKKKNGNGNFLRTRLRDEAIRWLLRRSPAEYLVDLTYAFLDGTRQFAVLKNGAEETTYVPASSLEHLTGRTMVLGSVDPDMFFRSSGETALREDGRAFLNRLLPGAVKIRLYDPLEAARDLLPEDFVRGLGDRRIDYSTGKAEYVSCEVSDMTHFYRELMRRA